VSFPAGFGTRPSVFVVRDVASSAPAARATFPSNVTPGYSRTGTFAAVPARTLGAMSCGTWTNTRTGSMATTRKSGVEFPDSGRSGGLSPSRARHDQAKRAPASSAVRWS
jgi:hypothetical protein